MNRQAIKFIATSIIVTALAPATWSNDRTPDLNAFKKCATIESDSARLACFDTAAKGFNFEAAAAKIAEAETAKAELAAIEAEKKQLAAEKATMVAAEQQRLADEEQRKYDEFGLPTYAGEQLAEFKASIVDSKKTRAGNVYITIGEGNIWKVIDKEKPRRTVKGTPVRIFKAMMGNYRMQIGSRTKAYTVKRILVD